MNAEFVKSYLLELLEKALKFHKFTGRQKAADHSHLVQVERTVSKPGVKPFQQKFWVKPDQVKNTDVVLSKPQEDKTPLKVTTYQLDGLEGNKTINMHYNQNCSFDSSSNNFKVSPKFVGVFKDVIEEKVRSEARTIAHDLDMNQRKYVKDKKIPSDLTFKVSVVDASLNDQAQGHLTLQYITPFTSDEVDSKMEQWLDSALSMATLGGNKELTHVLVNGHWACQIKFSRPRAWENIAKTIVMDNALNEMKDEIARHLATSKTELTKEDIQKDLNTAPTTDREKELFGSLIESATPSQLRDFRTVGIIGNDSQSNECIHNLYTSSILQFHLLKMGLDDPSEFLNKLSLSQAESTLKEYANNLAKTLKSKIGLVENNEIKTKISSVTGALFDELSNQVEKDWDQEEHGKMKYKIHGIYKVENIPMEQEYDKIVSENEFYSGRTAGGKNCQKDTFYHGTGFVGTSFILGRSGGFEIVEAKCGRMLGDGIYLADISSKSAQYVHDDGFSRDIGRGMLMICEASLGECYWNPPADIWGNIEFEDEEDSIDNYDSCGVDEQKSLVNKEWCVFNTKAVKPCYLIDLEILREGDSQ